VDVEARLNSGQFQFPRSNGSSAFFGLGIIVLNGTMLFYCLHLTILQRKMQEKQCISGSTCRQKR
ncbi:hypothetical protein F442_09946, partial [Phytophthora nicotianae P10297]